MTRLDYLTDRLDRLADALGTLRVRVREAVAAELGKAVGHAVQDVLEAFARGRPTVPAAEGPYRPAGADDDDPWADEADPVATPHAGDRPDEPAVAAGRPTAVGAAWRRWRARWGRAGLGVALALAAAALAGGGPIVAAGVRIAALAADLLDVGRLPLVPALPGP